MTPLILLALACAPPEYVGPEPVVPTITILFPNPDYFSDSERNRPICPDFQIVVEVDNFELAGASTEDVDGQGHWHLYIDDPALENYLAVGDGEVIDMPDPLSAGNHTLYAALRQNTHGPLPEDMVENESDLGLSEITVADSEDCIGNQNSGS